MTQFCFHLETFDSLTDGSYGELELVRVYTTVGDGMLSYSSSTVEPGTMKLKNDRISLEDNSGILTVGVSLTLISIGEFSEDVMVASVNE